MQRMHHRLVSALAAGTVALVLSASPALAGSDGCSNDGDCHSENAPAAVVPFAPTPVPQAALQVPQTPTTASERETTVAEHSVPRGAVAAGEGGSSHDGNSGVIFGVAGAALVILAAGGRLVVAARRSAS
jgi:hypothetical protein